jgi:hypothetical protein
MSLFQRKPEDPIAAELQRLKREQQFLEKQAREIGEFEPPQEEPPPPAAPAKPPVRLVFNEAPDTDLARTQERRLLGVERKMARNRVILLGMVLAILLIAALRMLSSI